MKIVQSLFLYEPELIGKFPNVFDRVFKSFNQFFLSEVHFITSKGDSREVVDSDPNDDVIHPHPKEAMVGYASKNASLLLHVNIKIIDYKVLFS